MILILPGSALTENLARVSDRVRFQWQSKLPESAGFTCYFVRNQNWKTIINEVLQSLHFWKLENCSALTGLHSAGWLTDFSRFTKYWAWRTICGKSKTSEWCLTIRVKITIILKSVWKTWWITKFTWSHMNCESSKRQLPPVVKDIALKPMNHRRNRMNQKNCSDGLWSLHLQV